MCHVEGSPVVALLCEYDALPGLGHACGHNLIAESAIAAAVAAKELIVRKNKLSDVPFKGKIVVLGTPAEEGGMGKDLLLRAGAMDDIDAALMAHPENRSVLRMRLSSRSGVTMVFDSADGPDSGDQPSAMDAAVLAYSNMTLLRARMDPDSRMHGTRSSQTSSTSQCETLPPSLLQLHRPIRRMMSTETTTDFNVHRSRLVMNVRSPSTERVLQMRRDVEACAEAAAKATGCRVTISDLGRLCRHMNYNETMVRTFQKHADQYGMPFIDVPMTTGSTSDAGNVSHKLPTIHPVYRIDSTGFNHTREFWRVSGTKAAQETAVLVGKMLALTAFDLLCDLHLLQRVKKEFDDFAAQAV
ncbi:hypothetical protein MRX96_010861 [Rhipicephalus microplus]